MNRQSLTIATSLLFSCILLLTGCATFKHFGFNQNRSLSASAESYLQQATIAQGTDQQHYQLLAADELLLNNNLNDAEQLLDQMPSNNLNANIYDHKLILQAKLALQKDKPKDSLRYLNRIKNLNQLSRKIKIAYYDTASSAHLRNRNPAYSTLARISLTNLLQDNIAIESNDVIIWHNLQILPLKKLNQLLNRSNSTLLRGWVKLAIAAKQNANHPSALANALRQWKTQYPTHTANRILPNNSAINSLDQNAPPNQIALLLPLHGKFGNMGQAVRDGFMTAFYKESHYLAYKPDIKIYDTSANTDIETLYQQAIQNGAQFVIGPLTKNHVAILASNHISVPTLSLNYLPDDQSPPDKLLQLGLSPTQAAEQAAEQAWQQGIRFIATITPNTDWGNKVQQAFADHFSQLGGHIIDGLSFSPQDNLTKHIAKLLKINENKTRVSQLKSILKEKFKTTPRRRQDIQGFFLAATPNKARQIQPLLKFYYAGNLPVIAISNIYSGNINTRHDRDLNGIYFNTMPWLIANDSHITNLRNKISTLWPNNYRRNNRLYGLGIDAYYLSVLTPRLTALPQIAINGVTGQLYLGHNQKIYRQLMWAQFRGGKPIGIQ